MTAAGTYRRAALTSAALPLALAGLAGCLDVPAEPAKMCEHTSDCDQAHGEVCEENVCWGNPPPGPFSGVVSPPSTHSDLAPRELAQVTIPGDGRLDDIALEPPVLLSGRITAFCPPPMTGCDPAIAGATVTVSRHSQFPGGPGFKTVVNVDADTFSIPVPRTGAGGEPYNLTIAPDAGLQLGAQATPQPVPPRRTHASPQDNLSLGSLELGGADLPVLSGALTNSLGQGLAGYRVAALGRWDANEPATEVSSAALTDASGSYAIALSADLVGTVDLVARPPSGTVGPTLRVASIDATKSSQKNVMAPSNLGAPIQLAVRVNGVYRNGSISAVPGATVAVTAAIVDASSSFVVGDEQVTDQNGDVVLRVLDGTKLATLYRLSVTPPASSSVGALFDQKVSLTPDPGTSMPPIQLASRVALRGRVIDAADKPLANVAVTARPSLRFLWTLDAAPQAFVASIPSATTVTEDDGQFVVWVDASVAGTWGDYDLVFEAPTTSQVPTYLQREVEIPADGTLDSLTLDDTRLPEAAFVHGRIAGPDGQSVEGAELKLFRVTTELQLCGQVAHAPTSCPIPAPLQGRNTSDSTGIVRLALPR